MSPNTPTAFSVSQGSIQDASISKRWASLRSLCQQDSPFSSELYAAGLQEFAGFDHRIFIVSKKDRDLGGILVYFQQKGPFKVATVPPFTCFTSLLTTSPLASVSTSETGTPYTLLLRQLQEYFDAILLHHHPSLKDIRLFKWTSWKTTPLYTYHVDLSNPRSIQDSWSTSTKRAFKKHAPNHKLSENPEAIRQALQLAQASYSRHGRSLPLPLERLQKLTSHLHKAGMIRVFTLIPDTEKEPTAAVALLHDREVAYYWLAGSVPGHSMTVLLGCLLPKLAEEGFRLFDFVGANTPPIAEFKRRLGPTLIPYFATQCSPSKAFAMLQSLKRTFR